MADAIPATPQNPFAAPGTDPNAALFSSAIAGGTATMTTPGGQFYNIKPTSPVVSTSGPVNDAVNNLGNNISAGASSPPVAPTTSNPAGTLGPLYDPNNDPSLTASIDSANKPFKDRQAALQAERDAEIARLTEQQGRDTLQLKESQTNETSTTSRNLAYLQQGGQSASAQAYLNSLEVSHQREMDNLVAKYNSAIQTARNAYSDKDFQLAQQMVANAKAIKAAAADRNQNFLEYTLKLRQQANDEAKLQYDLGAEKRKHANEVLTFARDNGLHPDAPFFAVGGNIFDSLTGQSFDSKEAAIKAGVKADLSNVQMIEKAKDKKYSAGVIGEYERYLEDVAAGKAKYMTFNQYSDMDANRKVRIARAGGESPVDIRAKAATEAENLYDSILGAQVGSKDRYVSPQSWFTARDAWKKDGHAVSDFDKTFAKYTNPADPQDYGLK